MRRFFSVASYELPTPFTSMKLQIQALMQGFERGDGQAFTLQRIHRLLEQSDRQILRLTRLIDDMLNISRFRTGQLAIPRWS